MSKKSKRDKDWRKATKKRELTGLSGDSMVVNQIFFLSELKLTEEGDDPTL